MDETTRMAPPWDSQAIITIRTCCGTVLSTLFNDAHSYYRTKVVNDCTADRLGLCQSRKAHSAHQNDEHQF